MPNSFPIQPDLNYRNPDVKATMFDIVRFWLRKGIDGFRLDMINAIYEDAELHDSPFRWKLIPSDVDPDSGFRSSKYILNHPDNYQFANELRSVMDEFSDPDRFLVGEVSGPIASLQNYCGPNDDGLHLIFLFRSMSSPLKADVFRNLIQLYEKYFPYPLQPTWVFSNHDRIRRIMRLDNNILKAKLNCAFQMTVRGVPFAYYGEEIAQPSHSLSIKTTQDIVAMKYKKIPDFVWNFGRNVIHESINRDDTRTPMQWNYQDNAGFCPSSVKHLVTLTPSYLERNVERNLYDEDSIFHCYQRFLQLRKEMPALNEGSIELLPFFQKSKSILAYKRYIELEGTSQEVVVLLNFAETPLQFGTPIFQPQLLVSTKNHSQALSGNNIYLQGYEGIVIQKNPD